MNRRHVLAMIGSLVAFKAYHLKAASKSRVKAASEPRVIGFISGGDEASAKDFVTALIDELAARGFRERQNLRIECLYADFALERIPSMIVDLEHRRVEVIVTHAAATPIVVMAKRATPVVYEFSADPVATGIAKDLAHPLFNATGVTLMRAELNAKRLDFLHDIAPDVNRVAVIVNPLHAGEERERADLGSTAARLGIRLQFFSTPNREELDRALAAMNDDPPQAIVAFSEGFVVANRSTIIEFAMSQRIPVVSGWAIMAFSGALFTYGPRLVESYRRTGYFAANILNGKQPEEMAIEQPTIFEFVVNLKTAEMLNLTIPADLTMSADTLIER